MALGTVAGRPFRPPRSSRDFGFGSWNELAPRSSLTAQTSSRTVRIGLLTVAAATATVLAGLHWVAPTTLAALGVVALSRERLSRRRAATEMLAAARRDLRGPHDVADVRARLERVLEFDSDQDGARFLLACILLEEQRDLSALLQLAPLRDRHPDLGEVVLIAAAAYVNLSLHDDALRMLGVLEIEPEHPSLPAAAAMYHNCCTVLGRPIEGSSGLERTSSQASS